MIEKLKEYLKNNEVKQVESLLKDHPEVLSVNDENGSSGLMIIAYTHNDQLLQKAMKLKKSFSFHEAIICGQNDLVKDFLASEGSHLANLHSDDGFTPVSLASFFDQNAIVELLLENGADPGASATNPSRVNALHAAVARENYHLCKILIEKGSDVNKVQALNVTPLHSAAKRGNIELVKLLMTNGARADIKMEDGQTALSLAKNEGHTEVYEYMSNFSN